jgi:hypothetical protein
MNQIVHIFRKDTRQLRLEIIATLAIQILFDIYEPKGWINEDLMQDVSMALAALLTLSWGLLIIRLIQTDRLAGRNQFWTTRPIEWPKLLAAKGLFLLAYLYAPLILSQMLLLHLGGFAVTPHLALFATNTAMLCTLFLLLVCIATVTTSFGQAILALLGTLVVVVVIAIISSGRGLEPLFLGKLQQAIMAILISAGIVYQYRQRTTRKTLMVYAVAAALSFSTQWLLTGSSLAVTGYAAPSANAPVSFAIGHHLPNEHWSNSSRHLAKEVLLSVPLVPSSIAPGTSYSLVGQKIHLEGPGGTAWESQWERADALFRQEELNSSSDSQIITSILIAIPRSVYDRMSGGTVSMHIEFVATELQDLPAFRTTISEKLETVPGLGLCGRIENMPSDLECRSAFKEPPEFSINTYWNYLPGSALAPADLPSPRSYNLPAHGQIRQIGSQGMSISPIKVIGADFNNSSLPNGTHVTFVPGTPVTYSGTRMVRRLRVQTPAVTVSLKDYTDLNGANHNGEVRGVL